MNCKHPDDVCKNKLGMLSEILVETECETCEGKNMVNPLTNILVSYCDQMEWWIS